ncbi:MAG TPA: hypothetical protein VI790_00760 [Candidatus Nanoarchaeia archaeon]|nr:hypothetical protein [Candidatus Nanoarchaeia archaeon]
MDDLIKYTRLFTRLVTRSNELGVLASEFEKNSGDSLISNPNRNFYSMSEEIQSFLGDCFVRSYIKGFKMNAIYNLLAVIEPSVAKNFDAVVFSNFNLNDFIKPQARGGFVNFYTQFVENYDYVKSNINDEMMLIIDQLFKSHKKDFKTFSGINNNNVSIKRFTNCVNNYSKFIKSLRGSNYENLILLINNNDLLICPKPDDLKKFISGVSDDSLVTLKSIIDLYRNCSNHTAKNFSFNGENIAYARMMYSDLSKDMLCASELTEDASKLYC